MRRIVGFGMLFVSVLFSIAESRAENGLTFGSGQITAAGIELPYRIAQVSGTGKTSLVIYLHGGSSKGNDNELQMREAGIDSIANYLASRQTGTIFLVPQCPVDKSWGGPMLGVLKSLIDKYVGDGSADENCLYIFGGSMGGTGTWSMLSAYPGLFAAAMPVAGNPSKCDADKVASTPVYTVMGTSDRLMSIESASYFIDQLHARNGTARMDIEEGWTHEMTCIQSYTARRLYWVFSHGGNPAGVDCPTADSQVIESVQYYATDGRLLSVPPCRGLYIIRCIYKDGTVRTWKNLIMMGMPSIQI